jgi:hypothetical protein
VFKDNIQDYLDPNPYLGFPVLRAVLTIFQPQSTILVVRIVNRVEAHDLFITPLNIPEPVTELPSFGRVIYNVSVPLLKVEIRFFALFFYWAISAHMNTISAKQIHL